MSSVPASAVPERPMARRVPLAKVPIGEELAAEAAAAEQEWQTEALSESTARTSDLDLASMEDELKRALEEVQQAQKEVDSTKKNIEKEVEFLSTWDSEMAREQERLALSVKLSGELVEELAELRAGVQARNA
mmetsp:Transcript_36006/g.93664  ORF Transcript_36006/g.93664 Transcript_36006/m.93664 type:complete len:133 (-) Transcript_36006:195-593(-)